MFQVTFYQLLLSLGIEPMILALLAPCSTIWATGKQLLVLLEILMSKISLKYIPIHIYNFEHSRGIMNMKLSSHCFLFHRNINRRENKVQISLIIHHNEKSQRIYFWCAAKDNWASQISKVALRKELEKWKFPFPPSGQ